MQDSERDAKRLIGDDWSSWGARGRWHKAYRQMQVTPDEEVPKHRKNKKGRKKHVHKWGPWVEEGERVTFSWLTRKKKVVVVKWVRICKKCGHRDKGESLRGGTILRSRWPMW